MTDTPDAPAGPKRTYIPVLTDIIDVLRVLFSPGAVFEENQAKPRWLMTWLAVSILIVGLSFVNIGYVDRVTELNMALRAPGREVSSTMLMVGRIATIAFVPIVLLLLGLLCALIYWVVCMLTGEKVRYKGLLCVTYFSQATGVVQIILQDIAQRVRGTPAEAIKTPQDARMTFGLDLLLPAESTIPSFLKGLLMSIGPIQLWAIIIVTIGIMTVEKQKKSTALTAALTVWLISALLLAAFAGKAMGQGS